MKNTVTILVIIVIGAYTSYSQDVITLAEVHDIVINNSFDIKTANFQKQIALEEYKFYKSQLRPGVNLMGEIPNYSLLSAPVTQPDGSIAFQSIKQANSSVGLSASQVVSATGGILYATSTLNRFDNFSNNFSQYNGTPIRIGLIQPLIGFNPWKFRKKIEPLLLQESEKQYSIRLEEALTTSTILYFNILSADQNLKIAETNKLVNEKLLRITEERLRLGKVSLDEKLQLEIELNQAKLSASQATIQKSQAITFLFTYLGKTIPKFIEFETPEIAITDIDIASLNSAYTRNRPEIIAYQREIFEADSRIAEANALFGPGITLNASFGLTRGANNVSDIYSNPFAEQQANISFSMPILDWGKKKSAVAQARIAKEDTEARYKQQLLELENGITQRAFRLLGLKAEIILLNEIMNKADQRAKISNERYILGDIDITNLTLAQRDKDQARRNYINSLQSLWTTYYELRGLTGYDVVTQAEIAY